MATPTTYTVLKCEATIRAAVLAACAKVTGVKFGSDGKVYVECSDALTSAEQDAVKAAVESDGYAIVAG